MHLLNISRKKGKIRNLLQGNAEKLPFKDGIFPYILLTDVLEHVLHPSLVLEEIYRVSAKDGLFILSVPNDKLINRCKKIAQYLRLSKYFITEYHRPCKKSGNVKMDWHIHEFTLKKMKDLLKKRWNINNLRCIPNILMPFQFLFFLSPKK